MDKKPNRTPEQDLAARIDLLANSLNHALHCDYTLHRSVLNDLTTCLLNLTEIHSRELIAFYGNRLENLAYDCYQNNTVGAELLDLAALIRENYLAK